MLHSLDICDGLDIPLTYQNNTKMTRVVETTYSALHREGDLFAISAHPSIIKFSPTKDYYDYSYSLARLVKTILETDILIE
jgi:hypothetical protein